jgi:hypothetical protein
MRRCHASRPLTTRTLERPNGFPERIPMKGRKTGGRVAGTPNKATALKRLIAAGLPLPVPKLRVVRQPKQRMVRQQDTEQADLLAKGRKRCGQCKVIKPVAAFSFNDHTPSGLTWACKLCINERTRRRYAIDPSLRRRRAHSARRHNYGITAAQFDALLCEQAGRCKCCDDSLEPGPKDMGVDHCHDTGHIRGLLCRWCNVGLGFAKNSPARLRLMIAYLQGPSVRL